MATKYGGFPTSIPKDLKNPRLAIVNLQGFGTMEILILRIFKSNFHPYNVKILSFANSHLHIDTDFSAMRTDMQQ